MRFHLWSDSFLHDSLSGCPSWLWRKDLELNRQTSIGRETLHPRHELSNDEHLGNRSSSFVLCAKFRSTNLLKQKVNFEYNFKLIKIQSMDGT